jgi:hypothetical protein
MSSATDVCNLALMHLKTGLRIGNIATDTTETGLACALIYPLVRDDFQNSRPWNFCKKTASLVPVAQNPNNVWAFSYTYPPDCLYFRRIQALMTTPGDQNNVVPSSAMVNFGSVTTPQMDTQQSAIAFEVADGLIYTNQPNAIGEYTFRNEDEGTWPVTVVIAMSYAVAAMLAPIVTDGDPFNMIGKMEQLAKIKTDIAAAQNANERMAPPPDSEFTRIR